MTTSTHSLAAVAVAHAIETPGQTVDLAVAEDSPHRSEKHKTKTKNYNFRDKLLVY